MKGRINRTEWPLTERTSRRLMNASDTPVRLGPVPCSHGVYNFIYYKQVTCLVLIVQMCRTYSQPVRAVQES